MPANLKRIFYFHPPMASTAAKIRAQRADIAMDLADAGNPDQAWAEIGRSHGYHVSGRTELSPPWFPDAKLLSRSPDLLAVCSLGAGYDVIDVDACTRAGVIVCNQAGSNKEAVAEHALGLMLNLSKQITKADRAMRREDNVDRYNYIGSDLLGKTVGIIGLGNIGSRVAELCRVLFKMTVLACDPYLSAQQIEARGAVKTDLNDLLGRSDFVTVHCPRNSETSNLMSYEQFARMKPSAYFVNTARGGTYSEEDLARALREQRIAGAGVDVFLKEPPSKDHPLMAFENVICSPHNGGITHDAIANMETYAADQWVDIFDGKVPPRLINPGAWPLYSERFERILGFRPASLR